MIIFVPVVETGPERDVEFENVTEEHDPWDAIVIICATLSHASLPALKTSALCKPL